MRRLFSGLVVLILLINTLTLAVNIQPVKSSGTVGVKAGDWIKCAYTISGWPSGTPYPEWLKVEFLSVEGTNATIRVTMHMSDGTEQNDTMTVDVTAGGGTFQGLSGFVIPANCTTGDPIYMTGYGNVTIDSEATRTYAGATRTVVHASFSQYGTQLTYHWDKLTGVMVEASVASGGVTGTAKATETNMWQPEPTGPFYIRADGSIDPPTAPISTEDNVTYVLTDTFFSGADGIVVERDNIVVDGSGFAIVGTRADLSSGINLSERNNVTIQNTNIKNFYFGILLNSSSNNSISGNNVAHNSGYGIGLASSSNNIISGNTLTDNQYDGIGLDHSSINNISGNTITNNQYEGIGLYDSSNNSMNGNNISDNRDGILFISSSNNNLSGNAIANSRCGTWLVSSSNNNVGGNAFIGDGLAVLDSHMNFVGNNTVNGKPLVYLEGVADYRVDDAGQVVLIRCDRIRVEDLNLSRTFVGVELCETTNSIISQNNVMTTNDHGIWLVSSSGNSISGNAITDNGLNTFCIELENSSDNSISGNKLTDNNGSGIWLSSSSSNSISGNNIVDNFEGIGLGSSSNNSVKENTITNNVVGIGIYSSSNNSIIGNNIAQNRYTGLELGYDTSNNTLCHNNFINNTNQVYSYSNLANVWDYGFISGGNYWSDYGGTDLYSGVYQNETGSDGLGDTAYTIDVDNVDHYPLMKPWGTPQVIMASVDAYPGNLNLCSKDSQVSFYIELPEGYSLFPINPINVSTIILNGTVEFAHTPFTPRPPPPGDHNNNSIPDLMIAFNRAELVDFMLSQNVSFDNVTLSLTGQFYDGTQFEGSCLMGVSALTGDANCDGQVSLQDLQLLAGAYNSHSGDASWDGNANFVEPWDRIGLTDLVTVAVYYGQHSP